MKNITVLFRASGIVFFRRILILAIILLFFNNSKSQVLSQMVKEQLWEYENLQQYEQYGYFDFDIFYKDMINDTVFSDIDSLFIQPHGFIICAFYTLIPHDYAHLLIVVESRFLIVNMREPLDEVVSKVSNFICDSNEVESETEIWSHVIGLHYANRTVDVFDRPPNWSYDPLKSSIER